MGDMGDYYRDLREDRKARKAERDGPLIAEAAEKLVGWSKLGFNSWDGYRLKVTVGRQTDNLDYWPTTGAVRWKGRTYHNSIDNILRIAEGLKQGLTYKEARDKRRGRANSNQDG
ncbi:hypothetical protein [Sphingomonas phage Kimi]|nr:hypothetical protein [Sphingomonas phage Kimi]